MFNSRLEEITNYLMYTKTFLPIYQPISRMGVYEDASSIAPVNSIDLSDYAHGIFHYVSALQKENEDLKKTLKKLAENDYNIHWYRPAKVEILEKYFPELIEKLPYYAGGKALKGE